MKSTIEASYKVDNAQDLFELLANFSAAERSVIHIRDYDCLQLEVDILSDKSEVLNLKGRWFTAEQRRRERGGI